MEGTWKNRKSGDSDMSKTTDRYIKELTEGIESYGDKVRELAEADCPAYDVLDLAAKGMLVQATIGILLRLDEYTTHQEAYWRRNAKEDQKKIYTGKKAYRREDE